MGADEKPKRSVDPFAHDITIEDAERLLRAPKNPIARSLEGERVPAAEFWGGAIETLTPEERRKLQQLDSLGEAPLPGHVMQPANTRTTERATFIERGTPMPLGQVHAQIRFAADEMRRWHESALRHGAKFIAPDEYVFDSRAGWLAWQAECCPEVKVPRQSSPSGDWAEIANALRDDCPNGWGPAHERAAKLCEQMANGELVPASEVRPVEMQLRCPQCDKKHVDRGEWETKLHRSHLCECCGHVWRPFEYYTVGVR